jgi:hypothetical protein
VSRSGPFHSLNFAPLPNTAVLAASRPSAFGTRTILDKSNRFQGQGWTVVRAGFRRRAKRSPTGFRSRLGQAPSSVAATVSPRSKPEDNPVAGTQTWSKRTRSLWQRRKVQKVLWCLTTKSSPRDAQSLLPKGQLQRDETRPRRHRLQNGAARIRSNRTRLSVLLNFQRRCAA